MTTGATGYEILRPLARGGMADVLVARRLEPDGTTREVAIKRILPELAEDGRLVGMFLDEANLARRIRHPNVVSVLECGRADFGPFLAMELVDGLSLELLRAGYVGGRMPTNLACAIVVQACRGLHHAHALTDEHGQPLGIVHRDVSPPNILLGRDGVVRVADFGVSKAKTHAMRTLPGVLKGKVSYMAPEQVGSDPVDARADVFALGVILYECLTGQRLYQRPRPLEAIEEIVSGPVPSPRESVPGMDPHLDEIVRRCLAKSPDDRFRTAAELGDALERFLVGRGTDAGAATVAPAVIDSLREPTGPTRSTKATPAPPARKAAGPSPVQIGMIALLVMAGLALLAALVWS